MPTIVHDGRTYVLKTTRYKCLLCGTLAESSSTRIHEVVACSCGQLSIDGGITAGGTINGDPRAMEDLSVYRTEDRPKVQLPQSILTEKHERIKARMLGLSPPDIALRTDTGSSSPANPSVP